MLTLKPKTNLDQAPGREVGTCVRDMAPLGKLETSLSYYNVQDLF